MQYLFTKYFLVVLQQCCGDFCLKGAQPVLTSPESDTLLPEKALCETGQGSSDPRVAKPLTEFSSGDEQESKLCCPKSEQDAKRSRESLVDDSCRLET